MKFSSNLFASPNHSRQQDLEMGDMASDSRSDTSGTQTPPLAQEKALDKKFRDISDGAFPDRRLQAHKSKAAAVVGALVSSAAVAGGLFTGVKSVAVKQNATFTAAKEAYCAQFSSFTWLQPLPGSSDPLAMQNVPDNLQQPCLANFGTDFVIQNPNPVSVEGVETSAGPFPRHYDPNMEIGWAEDSFYQKSYNFSQTRLVGQGIQPPNKTAQGLFSAENIRQYCDQFASFTWLSAGVGAESDTYFNTPANLTTVCLNDFGTNKTIQSATPILYGEFANRMNSAGPFPLSLLNSHADGEVSEYNSYVRFATKQYSDIESMGIQGFSTSPPFFTMAAAEGLAAGGGALAAFAGFFLVTSLAHKYFVAANSRRNAAFGKTVEQANLFATQLAGVKTFASTQPHSYLQGDFLTDALTKRVADQTELFLSKNSVKKLDRATIWSEAVGPAAARFAARWVEDKMKSNELLQMADKHADLTAMLTRELGPSGEEFRDFAAWSPNREQLEMFEKLLSLNLKDNEEAKTLLQRMAFLAGPALPLSGASQKLEARPEDASYTNLFEKSLALMPKVEKPNKYYELYYGSLPAFATVGAHGDEGIPPSQSLARTTETLQGAFEQAWLADGRKIGSETKELLEELNAEGCSEGKVRAIADWLANKALNADAILRAGEVWREVDAGDKSHTDVMSEHVRHQYVLAWQRYAADHNYARKLTQELAARIDQDPKWSEQYFSATLLKGTLIAAQERIAQLPEAQLDALIAEQESFGVF